MWRENPRASEGRCMSGIGQRLARIERTIWGDIDPDWQPPRIFNNPPDWVKARTAVRDLRIAEAKVVLALPHDDALAIECHFQSHPKLRRARNFLDYARAILAERERAGIRSAAA